jgi:hypothetical protein
MSQKKPIFVVTTVTTTNQNIVFWLHFIVKKKAVPETGREGLQDCEMLRIPHCLDNRLTDGG